MVVVGVYMTPWMSIFFFFNYPLSVAAQPVPEDINNNNKKKMK